ncbi:MAG: hypothetical protein K8F59_13020 [Rhodobacteraceae bacterium]|nr:hypothetical protein [Paracoccaceae bacterium]
MASPRLEQPFFAGTCQQMPLASTPGNDVVNAGFLTTSFDGQGGTDHLILNYSGTFDGVTADWGHLRLDYDFNNRSYLESVYYTPNGGAQQWWLFSITNFESFEITGSAGDDHIYTKGGDDIIRGGAGNDTLYGGDGVDEIYGGADDDTIYGDANSGSTAANYLDGGTGDDTIISYSRNDTVIGGLGTDLLQVDFSSDTIGINADITSITDNWYAVERFTGRFTQGDDIVNAGFARDSLDGYLGTDRLILNYSGTFDGLAADWVHLRLDYDSFSSGFSELVYYTPNGGAQQSWLFSIANFESFEITGSAGDDFIHTKGGDDIIRGGAGNDTINAGGGKDLIVVGRYGGWDTISGFEIGIDKVNLGAFTVSRVAKALDAYQSGEAPYMELGAGTVLSFSGIDIQTLSLADFDFSPTTDYGLASGDIKRFYSIDGASAAEGETLVFNVHRTGDISSASRVDIRLSQPVKSAATPGDDYRAPASLEVWFAAGSDTATFEVEALHDGLSEKAEIFLLELINTDDFGAIKPGGGYATGLITEDFGGAPFDTGDFILNLQDDVWAMSGVAPVASGDMLIRHKNTSTNFDHIMAIRNAEAYRVEFGKLVVTNAEIDLGSIGSLPLSLSGPLKLNFSIDLETGAIAFSGGVSFDLGLMGINLETPQLDQPWIRLETNALVFNPEYSLPGWLAPVTDQHRWSSEIGFELVSNSDGLSVGFDTRLSFPGPYGIDFLNIFVASASDISIDYETGMPGTFADDILTIQGQIAMSLSGYGELVFDIGKGVDPAKLEPGESRYLQIRDKDGDGDADFVINARADLWTEGKLFGLGIESGYVEIDNTGSGWRIEGGATILFGNYKFSGDFEFKTDPIEKTLQFDAITVGFYKQHGGWHFSHGVFLNGGSVGVKNLADTSYDARVTLTGATTGFWMVESLAKFEANAAISTNSFEFDGTIDLFNFTINDIEESLISVDGKLSATWGATGSAKLSGEASVLDGMFSTQIDIQFSYVSQTSWKGSFYASTSVDLSWASIKSFITGNRNNSDNVAKNLKKVNDAEVDNAIRVFLDASVERTAWGDDVMDGRLVIGIDTDGFWGVDYLLKIDLTTFKLDFEFGRKKADQYIPDNTGTTDGATPTGIGQWLTDGGEANLLMSASWDNAAPGAALRVVTPDGTIIDEADFAAHGITIFAEMTTDFARTVQVTTPATGLWAIQLLDPTGLGGITFDAWTPPEPLGFAFTGLAVNAGETQLTVDFDLGGVAAASVSLYAIAGAGHDASSDLAAAILLGRMDVATGPGSLDPQLLTGLLPGTYQIYAVVSDGLSAPEIFFAADNVQITLAADLALSVQQSETALVTGQDSTIDIEIVNSGTRAALNVAFEITATGIGAIAGILFRGTLYAPGSFEIAELAVGARETATLLFTAGETTGPMAISVSTQSPNAEPNPDDNTVSAGFTIRDPFHRLIGTGAAEALVIGDINGVIMAGGGDDSATGADGDDLLFGENGADNLNGGAGNDYLSGGGGEDVLRGGAGRDELHGGARNDRLIGGEGSDRIYGEAGDDVLNGGEGGDILDGGLGNDTVTYASSELAVRVDLMNNAANGGGAAGDEITSVENLTGSDRGDTLSGNRDANVLDGGSGHDTINGRQGNDQILGRKGNDILIGGGGADALYGHDGNDDMRGGSGDDLLNGGAGMNRMMGEAGNDRLVGGNGADTLSGGGGLDVLEGARGNDLLNGGGGDDDLDGGNGNDDLTGGAGADTLSGKGGNDFLKGGSGADLLNGGGGADDLRGGTGDDRLLGGAGADIVDGGRGNDIMSGNGGRDIFHFASRNEGHDTITDFELGSDLIRIDAGIAFSDLIIAASGADCSVKWGSSVLILTGIDHLQIDAADFQFL